jgi:hypothetical protein
VSSPGGSGTSRTIMINFAGTATNLTNSTKAAMGLIGRLGGVVSNIGKSFVSALGGNFKPLLKTVVGGIMAFAKVLFIMPSFLLALVNPFNVVNMALTGFSAAITATSPEAFVGATRNMAPAMKEAVMAVRLLSPQLKNLYGIIQQGFWAGFATDINSLTQIYFPILGSGLGKIATMLGNLRHDLFMFLEQPQVVAAIQAWMDAFAGMGGTLLPLIETMLPTLITLFTSMAQIMISLLPIVTALVGWFSHLLSFIAPILAGIGSIVGGAGAITGGGGGTTGGTSGSSGGGFFSNLFHGITSFIGGLFGGGRAGGGPVFGGRSYLVGERGPEMLSLNGGGSGFVHPGNGGGDGHTFVNVKIGERELRDIVSHEVNKVSTSVAMTSRMGRGLVV